MHNHGTSGNSDRQAPTFQFRGIHLPAQALQELRERRLTPRELAFLALIDAITPSHGLKIRSMNSLAKSIGKDRKTTKRIYDCVCEKGYIELLDCAAMAQGLVPFDIEPGWVVIRVRWEGMS